MSIINVSRIDLADALTPDMVISALLKAEPNLSIPVPVERLCEQLDILEIKGLETEGFEGGLITQQEKKDGIILCNKNSYYTRQRFTIAHELGHFLLPRHMPNEAGEFLCSLEDMRLLPQREENRRKKMEIEANRFAALLLMPPPKFRADTNKHKQPSINRILELAEKYSASKEATSRMYVEYLDDPCAIIVAHRGKILRCYKGREFPHIEQKYGTELPSASLSKRFITESSNISDIERTNVEIWLASYNKHRNSILYEQVLKQRDEYSLSLLYLETLDEEEEYEEDLIERSWQPPSFTR